MKSRLLTDNDYRNMAGMTSVSDALVYLKKTPGYGHLLADQDETALHRNEIETLLIRSVYRDYQKLYRFSFHLPAEIPGCLFRQIRDRHVKRLYASGI